MVIMGGRWDKNAGKEYNFTAYSLNREAAAYLCEYCPVPLTFLGYETGKDIITGGKNVPGLTGTAYAAHLSPKGRPSWDPMTVLYAVIGDAEQAGYRKIRGRASVNAQNGKNRFIPEANGSHSYLVKKRDDRVFKNRIDEILMMPPENCDE